MEMMTAIIFIMPWRFVRNVHISEEGCGVSNMQQQENLRCFPQQPLFLKLSVNFDYISLEGIFQTRGSSSSVVEIYFHIAFLIFHTNLTQHEMFNKSCF